MSVAIRKQSSREMKIKRGRRKYDIQRAGERHLRALEAQANADGVIGRVRALGHAIATFESFVEELLKREESPR